MTKIDKSNWNVIFNPHAGGGKGKRDKIQIENLLLTNGFRYTLSISNYAKHAIKLTKSAIKIGARRIIVVGGDGTLNEVVNGIFLQEFCSPQEICLGIIPVGTGNDWIKTFGIPNDYQGAIQKIKLGKVFQQDVGILTFSDDNTKQVRYFANMAGFGFDALVANKANQLKQKGQSGFRVYLQSLLAAFVQYKIKKVNILIDGIQIEDLIFSVSIGIGKYNGGGMMQAPNAIPNNGSFEVTLIKKIGVWGILTNLIGLYNGNYTKDKRVLCYQAKNIIIESEKTMPAEVDGESLGYGQFQIEILTKTLNVFVGQFN